MKPSPLLVCFLSLILLFIAFFSSTHAYTIWVSLIPWFFFLGNEKDQHNRLFMSFFIGLFFYLYSLYWLSQVTLLGYFLLACYLAFYFPLFAHLYSIFTKEYPRLTLITIPSLWVFLEYIRIHLFTGFPWFFLGQSQYAQGVLIQLCSYTGPLGVSFLIVMINQGLYEIVCNPRGVSWLYRLSFLSLLVSILGGILVLGFFRLHIVREEAVFSQLNKMTITVVQGNIPQKQKWDPLFKKDILKKYVRLSQVIDEKTTDLVIWPEAALPGYLRYDEEIKETVSTFVEQKGIPLLTGGPDARKIDEEKTLYYNSSFLLSKIGLIMDKYHKIKLVPFGEYVPSFFRTIIPFIGSITGGEDDFSRGGKYTIFYLNHRRFAVSICFEAIFPDFIRQFVVRGAEFIVNITNDAWFGNTTQPLQDMALNIFSAVSNGIPIVRSTNTGVSCFIDQLGRVQSVLFKDNKSLFVDGVLTDTITLNTTKTFYLRFGNWFVYLCIFFILCLALLKRIMKKRE
ncbi:apolipoprotein N-acyltransferase [Chlamydiota bacterium]